MGFTPWLIIREKKFLAKLDIWPGLDWDDGMSLRTSWPIVEIPWCEAV